MPEEFDIQKVKENYPEILEIIPSEIIDLATSEDTQNSIAGICIDNDIESEEIIENIAYYIGLSLLGELPIQQLTDTLVEKVGLEHGLAEKIYTEIDQVIFDKVRSSLEELYKKRDQEITEGEIDELSEEQEDSSAQETQKAGDQESTKDTYRENIE